MAYVAVTELLINSAAASFYNAGAMVKPVEYLVFK